MIVAHLESKIIRNKVRGILARYMYRIDSDIYIWSKKSIIEDIQNELSKIDQTKFIVTFYYDDKTSQTGFRFLNIGELSSLKKLSPLYVISSFFDKRPSKSMD